MFTPSLVLLVLAAPTLNATAAQVRSRTEIRNVLKETATSMNAPAVAGAFIENSRIVAADVYGKRHIARPDAPTLEDRFHIGSLTKMMTTLVIYRLIEAGQLSRDTTLAQALPDVPMREEYRSATIGQLLSFRAGIPPYMQISPDHTPILFELADAPAEKQRERFIAHLLQEPPVALPGEKRVYSNASYALLGQIARRKTGKSWEEMVREWVFRLLGLTSGGFGDPGEGRPNNVVAHRPGPEGLVPLDDPTRSPRLYALSAAGDVHMSITDLAKFAYELVLISRGESRHLKQETQRLMAQNEPIGEGSMLFGGSHMYTAAILLTPSQKRATVAATNRGFSDAVVEAVIAKLSGTAPPKRVRPQGNISPQSLAPVAAGDANAPGPITIVPE